MPKNVEKPSESCNQTPKEAKWYFSGDGKAQQGRQTKVLKGETRFWRLLGCQEVQKREKSLKLLKLKTKEVKNPFYRNEIEMIQGRCSS